MTYEWPEDLVEEQIELAMLLAHDLAVGGASVGYDELLDAMAMRAARLRAGREWERARALLYSVTDRGESLGRDELFAALRGPPLDLDWNAF